jgi:hypothetical protein
MNLYQSILAALPELADKPSEFIHGSIELRNDGDGSPDYIYKWNYSKPLPNGFKVGK